MIENRRGSRAPVLWCLLAAGLFGASTPASKLLLTVGLGPVSLAGLLYLGAAVASLPFAFSGGSAVARRDPRNVRKLLAAAVFGGVLGPVALLVGLSQAPAASVALWLNLETPATSLLAWAFFREHMHGRDWLAGGLVVLAGLLLAVPDHLSLAPAGLLVGLACLCWGLDNNLTATIDGYTPAQITCVKGFLAGSFNLALGIFLQDTPMHWPEVLAAMSIGALAYGLSIVLYIASAQQLGASRSQMIFASAPFFGVGLAWGLLAESFLLVQGIAAALMVVAIGILLGTKHSHAHRHRSLRHTHLHRHDDGHHDHAGYKNPDHSRLPAEGWHTHEHDHSELDHDHPHQPDLHHRHRHS